MGNGPIVRLCRAAVNLCGDDLASEGGCEQNRGAAVDGRGLKQRSCRMSLIALFSEYFWLLFAMAVSIAVLRELRIKRDEPSLRETQRSSRD
jgi:hypothetical protein